MGIKGDGTSPAPMAGAEKTMGADSGVSGEAPGGVAAGRRRFLAGAGLGLTGLGLAGAALGAIAAPGTAGAADTPIGEKWWPSRWGPDDQAGASNHMTPEKTLAAVQQIRTGKVHSLGRVYERDMPLFGERVFALRTPGMPTGGTFGDNKIIWNDEFLATEIGQVGTQFDGLGHIGVEAGAPGEQTRRRLYNGVTMAEAASPYGLKKLGVENVKPFFTPGLLVDVMGLKGGMLEAGTEVTLADLLAALERQGLSAEAITPGDVVMVRTGWGLLWKEDNARYNNGAPGIGLEVARYLAERQVSLVGADTWGVEVVPNPDSNQVFPVHQELLVRHGIYLQENLDFESLAADGTWQFAYVFAPLPIKGATGSPGNPLAVT